MRRRARESGREVLAPPDPAEHAARIALYAERASKGLDVLTGRRPTRAERDAQRRQDKVDARLWSPTLPARRASQPVVIGFESRRAGA